MLASLTNPVFMRLLQLKRPGTRSRVMSRQWSCETLGDGFQNIMVDATGTCDLATTEAELQKQIQDACLKKSRTCIS